MDWNEAELENLPPILREKTESRVHEILTAEPGLESLLSADPKLRAQLLRVASLSPFAARIMASHPELLRAIIQHGGGQPDSPSDRLHEYLARSPVDPTQALRLWRQEMILGVIWRDLNGLSDLSRTLEELSNCADLALQAASRIATRELGEGYGLPKDSEGRLQELVILAMGKLGGGELNLSSDIDLIFLYPAAGTTDGPRQLDNQQYFQRLGQRIIYLLDKATEQGRVYRVDMRLRPFGDAGPLVLSFNALEIYLQESGRDWERYAYVKARAVTAAAMSEDLFKNVLRPFVYRRYLDYGVFEALRDMREMIAREVKRRDLRENIKLGPGGIREIEFIAQCLQLIRGGSQPALRRRSLLEVLTVLEQHRYLPTEAAAELADAYEFLRNLENRIQAAEDRQTHDLPSDSLARAMLTGAMNLPDWEQLIETLRQHTRNVSHWFDKLIPQPDTDDDVEARQAFAGIWDGSLSEADANKLLQQMKCAEPAKVLRKLRALAGGSLFRRLDQPGGDRLRQLLPSIVRLAAPRLDAPRVLERLFTVLEAVGRRSAYFAMLRENPAALERLVELCGASDFLTRQVAGSPLLLDELLDPNLLNLVPDRQQFIAELDNRTRAAAPDDPEQQHDALRRFQNASVFRVALADLDKRLPLMKVSDRLTDIAELVLQRSLHLVWDKLLERQPGPTETMDVVAPGFLVLAYGKLGGLELAYGSDLDLVFLHEADLAWPQDKLEDGMVFYSRLGRRLVSFLSIQTPAGRLYEVDMRLRPSGQAGLLVSSFAAFSNYQIQKAWTWEHQALLRARPVAGDQRLARRFNELRNEVLTRHIPEDGLAERVSRMRSKMRQELSRSGSGQFDIKQDAGGIADIEFLVQYLVLREARRNDRLIVWPDNMRQLEALSACGVLEAEQTRLLMEAYLTYRRRLHHLSLEGGCGVVDGKEFLEEARAVSVLWQELIGE
ncbi:MAG: bifunctional [glutamate--ammonia ligase]-adenylyl-L-tyrosine phosphorylase/[glutamate--ammonia-ligase] adenylyltransferase [Gammaproteobacteria bacterium]|nr:bifunctional [glutamate--ammonia ligase]-adenylyl-L-tyrosine phosphorylase/[glutamate--ammonia-ligase] adenylyltransferase [Gammaproteobacteria bacterium]